jgi:pimeloyl-ACP methyl ester carboxylesterase
MRSFALVGEDYPRVRADVKQDPATGGQTRRHQVLDHRLAQIAVPALVIADASHLSAIEQPERFAAPVQEFIRELYA